MCPLLDRVPCENLLTSDNFSFVLSRPAQATLKAGKPVGASNAPPPVPVMPQTWGSPSAGSDLGASTSTSPSLSNNNKPKRSKSLAARFRAGRKTPTNPLSDGDSPGPPGGGGEDGRHAGTAYESDGARSVPVSPTEDRRGRNEWPLGASVPASMGSSAAAPSHSYPYPSGAVASPPASSNGHGHGHGGGGPVEQLEIRTQAIKFDESLSSPTLERTSAGMMSRSLTDEGLASPTSASGGGKKGHGLKRLFSTKRKVRCASLPLSASLTVSWRSPWMFGTTEH